MIHTEAKLPHGTSRCRCSGCGEFFTSVSGFDDHRVGKGRDRHCIFPGYAGLRIKPVKGGTAWHHPIPEEAAQRLAATRPGRGAQGHG